MEGSSDQAQNQGLEWYKDNNISGIPSSSQFLKFSVNILFTTSLQVYSID